LPLQYNNKGCLFQAAFIIILVQINPPVPPRICRINEQSAAWSAGYVNPPSEVKMTS